MKKLFLFATILFFSVNIIQAQKSATFKTGDGAIRGYDPVAYFNESKPVKGNPGLTYKWKESDWYFSGKQNLEAFKANPEKYAPQYGGYCAYGTADGHKAPTDPDAWTITDGNNI